MPIHHFGTLRAGCLLGARRQLGFELRQRDIAVLVGVDPAEIGRDVGHSAALGFLLGELAVLVLVGRLELGPQFGELVAVGIGVGRRSEAERGNRDRCKLCNKVLQSR